MDSWFHKLPFSNHWEWTYAYFIFVKHYESLPYFKSEKMSAVMASILLLNFSICSTVAKPSVFLLQSPFLF